MTTNPPGTSVEVFWTSLSPTLLSFSGATATALLPGTARVVATAGAHSDTADVQILQRPARVGVTPATVAVELGTDVTFTGTVLDPRGAAIAGQAVLWRSLDPTILESLGNGRFRTIGSGSGRAEARAAADTTLKATGTASVTRRPVDVSVAKTVAATQAFVGDPVVYTVTVANLGGIEAANVNVRDQLPGVLTLESSQPSRGTFTAATGTWAVGTLAAGASATLELRTRLSSGTPGTAIANTAERLASTEQADPNPANDRSTAIFTIAERTVDISVRKTASRAVVPVNDTVTFTVTVTNGGATGVTNLAVGDSLPSGLTYVSDQPARGSFDRGLRSWAVGALAAGESVTLNVVMRANAGSGGTTQTNVATVGAFDGPRDVTPGNNRATASVTVQNPNQTDLQVTKTAAATTRQPGDSAIFTVKVKNLGTLAATAVEVRDSLSAGLTFVSTTPTVGTFSATTMVWTVPTLAAGDSAMLTVRTLVNTGTTGTTQTNTARYLVTGPIGDPNAANNAQTASVTIPAPSADVEVAKIADITSPFEQNAVRFTVTATNLGPNAVTNLRIRDILPTGLTLDSVRALAGSMIGDTAWTIPSLAVSASAQMYVYVKVQDGRGGTTITNQASRVSMDQADPVSSNDVGTSTLTVLRRNLDLEVRKTASSPNPTVNTAFSYRVTVINRGPGAATGVQALDTLPSQFTVDSTRALTGSYSGSVWTIGSLNQGDSAVFLAYMRVPQAASGQTISNRARRSAQAQTDSFAANDLATATLTIPINNPPVVNISTPANNAVFNPGDTVTFVATATDPEDGNLTTAIVWQSNVSGAMGTGGTTSRSNLAPGPHLVSATVTDSNGNVAADTVPLTIAIVTTPTTLNVPYAGTASLPISLSAPAPAGGLNLTVTSRNPSLVGVATSSVTIPAGALSANATLSGVLPGSAVVVASTNGFGSDSTTVSVTAALNIVLGSVSFAQGFSSTFVVRLESQGVQIAAPSGGVSVTLTSANPACVAVTSPVVIPAGQTSVNATASWGGSATTPCNTTVTATAPSITQDAFTVYVNTPPAFTVYTTPVGSGLQTTGSVYIDSSPTSALTVRVQSLNPAVALVSPNATTAGTAFVDLTIPAGSFSVSYYLQGVEGATGFVPIQATATGITTDTTSVDVQQPAVTLLGLGTSYTSLSADQPFYAAVGTSDIYYGGVNYQNVRAGGTALTATITSSDTTKAALLKTAQSGSPLTVQIPVGLYYSPTSVATGGVALDLRTAGTTTVQASIPGFIQRPNATVNVTITAPAITNYGTTVGAGLQTSTSFYLDVPVPGGLSVTLVSANPSVVLLSPNATTAGTSSITVTVPNNGSSATYYVQGIAGTTGTSVVTASASGFTSGTATTTVVQPYVRLVSLGTSYTTLNADVAFQAWVGTSDLYYGGVNAQSVRAGGQPLTVTIASSDSTKARVVTSTDSGDTVAVTIPVGSYNSPTTVATGGVALDPLAAGSTTVTASIPGFVRATLGTVAVTITAPAINNVGTTVGAGLQTSTYFSLDVPVPGGLSVTLVSANPSVVLLSPNATTAGTSSITVTVPNNGSSATYYVQGIAGTTGTSVVTASGSGFTSDTANATVVQPYVTLSGPSTSTTTLSANQAFYAAVGLSDLYYGGVSAQNVRAGGTALTATITSSNQGVGMLQTTGGTSGSATVTIPVGQYYSPTSVAAGGVAFDPVGAGSTTVAVTIPNFLQRPGATVAVTVTSPGITMSAVTVGGGLMTASTAFLAAPAPAGTTLRIRSSSGAIAKVAPNTTTAGTDSIDVAVTTGATSVSFYVHGVAGQTGTVTFTGTAAGYTDGSAAMTVVQPALIISGLATSMTAAAADDVFTIIVGIPSGNSVISQARQGGAAGLVATVVSGTPAVGTLVTSAGTAASRTVSIAAGSTTSPGTVGTGGIAFDPLTAGSTTVSATIPGFISQPQATVGVTVTP